MSQLESAPALVAGPWFEDLEPGPVLDDAPGFTRTAGAAALHQRGRRLVCGGHTIPIAAAHATRAIPAWESCEHLESVFEGDVLRTELRVVQTAPDGLATLPARVSAERPETGPTAVLDWTFEAVVA